MSTTFLTGPAGSGKTTYAVNHLRRLLTEHIPGQTILVLTPQLTLAGPYRDLLRDPTLPGAATVDILTLNGLALQTIDLFWPLVADHAGFARPRSRPVFLTIETAQYYLRQAIDPLLRQGYFDPNVVPITISLPRLMSQILDNLNKAALIGLPHTEVGARLAGSLTVEPSSRVALEHTQACVSHFREFCLNRNLLDFSLRIDTFYRHLWPVEGIQQYLTRRYRHLIVDNLEEDTPFAHTVLRQWLPQTDSALLVNDEQAGYRIFLGANWRTAQSLAQLADQTTRLDQTHIAPPEMLALGERLAEILNGGSSESANQQIRESANQGISKSGNQRVSEGAKKKRKSAKSVQSEIVNPKSKIVNLKLPDPRQAMTFQQERFYPQMITWVIDRIEGLLKAGVQAEEIVVLAPFVSDALRFSFVQRMAQRGLPARSHRPSRPLNEEPAAKTILTLARLAFPDWGLLPEPFDLAQALSQAISELDLIRANLLTQVVYRPSRQIIDNSSFTIHNSQLSPATAQIPLTPFEEIEGAVRERISYQAGQRFDQLRTWLQAVGQAGQPPVLDTFFSRLFGEILSQPGFGFHRQPEAGQVIANLIDSARQFRRVAEQVPSYQFLTAPQFPTVHELNRAYLETIEQGIMAAQYIRGWAGGVSADLGGFGNLPGLNSTGAVLITPATTFLMSNRPVDYQFWLDAGSSGWWERIAQPLTHPYVLAADWEPGRPWTDADEVAGQRDRLSRLVLGLTRRCRQHIFMVNAEVGEQGYEQRGQLLVALQQMLRQMQREEE